jgi:RNA polymerase sigma factor (sigma-70 family)
VGGRQLLAHTQPPSRGPHTCFADVYLQRLSPRPGEVRLKQHPIDDPRYTTADAAVIKQMAWRFAHRFRRDDLEDVQQEVAMHVFQCTGRVDPARGSRAAFVNVIAKHRILQLIELQEAHKRGYRRTVQPVPWDQDWLTDHRTTPQRVDLAIDVRDAMGRMPADVRAVVELRMQRHTVRAIGEELGLSGNQVRHRLRCAAIEIGDLGLQIKKSQDPHPSIDGPGSSPVGESTTTGAAA